MNYMLLSPQATVMTSARGVSANLTLAFLGLLCVPPQYQMESVTVLISLCSSGSLDYKHFKAQINWAFIAVSTIAATLG